MGKQAASEQSLGFGQRCGILNDMIRAALVTVVVDRHGAPVDFAHEARFLATVTFVEPDQMFAQAGLEDAWRDQDRGMQWHAGMGVGHRQAFDQPRDRLAMGLGVSVKGQDRKHTHGRIDNHGLAAIAIGRLRAIERRDIAIGIPEVTNARHALNQHILILGITGHAEETDLAVIKMAFQRQKLIEMRAPCRIM